MEARFLILFGATASGKTALIEGLAMRGLPFELISADSMQVYRGMDIGTAKPDPALIARVPHKLIDIRDPNEQYCAGDFVRDALGAIRDANSRGVLPLVSGGTGFYLRNLVMGLSDAPPPDPAVRAALQRELAERGPGPLRAELEAADPASAGRIHPNDLYRLCRALEVLRTSGRPRSSFPPPSSPRADLRFRAFGIERPRGELAARIARRVASMLAAGLPAEVEGLRRAGYGPGDPGMAAIGYAEFFAAAAGDAPDRGVVPPFDRLPPGVLEEIERRIATNTRRYAKRQELFFRGIPGARIIPASEPRDFVEAALGFPACLEG